MKRRSRLLLSAVALLWCAALLAQPQIASAHGSGEAPSVMAGPLSWGFVAFGLLVITLISLILFAGNRGSRTPATAADFAGLSGFRGYLARMRLFSRNARLYILHVVGMDMIFGTWTVVFNLYLLAVGFDLAFIGLRILLASIFRAVFAVPAGLISDRIGRKSSFILGDGGGAVLSLIAITTVDPTLLLITGAVGGAFSSLHGVAEPAFMAENSQDFERIHLFSVADGTRIAAAIIGSALAGLLPLLVAGHDHAANVGLYRMVAYVGIAGWFASLIPAILLRQVAAPRASSQGLRALFAGVKHPGRIWRLTVPEVLVAMGAGFTLPLLNVFFKEHLGRPDVEIGAMFAAGQAVLVTGAFLAPLVVVYFGKVRSVVFTRLAALPFILLVAFSADVGTAMGSVFAVAGLAHIARITFANMASPIRSAFTMEILDPGERSTQVGLEIALSSALSGLTSYVGAWLMGAGDFRTPFFLMGALLLAGTALFWQFFARWEADRRPRQAQQSLEASLPGQ